MYSTVSLIIILKKQFVYCFFFYISDGQRLKKLLISVGNTGTENECGYFGKTANAADQILIYCANGAVGRCIVATINSNPGTVDILRNPSLLYIC